MKTYPLASRSLEEALELQFKTVDSITRHFTGFELLCLGDLGVRRDIGRPAQTSLVERVFAETFDAEDAALVRGAGTGSLRWSMLAAFGQGVTVLVHDAPIYPTTRHSLDSMGCATLSADFNEPDALTRACEVHAEKIDGVLVQHSRQRPDDGYRLGEVIARVRDVLPDVPVVSDDNYMAARARALGCQLGASLSTFSCFKLLGPEGVGAVIGTAEMVDRVRKLQYSGGSQVQGHEAMAALRGLVYAPVALATADRVRREVVERLCSGEVPHVVDAALANAESGDVLVEFDGDIAERVLELAPAMGAAPHPVGCESKYEICPLFYRVSSTFLSERPSWGKRVIRITVMRAGASTVIKILNKIMAAVDGAARSV